MVFPGHIAAGYLTTIGVIAVTGYLLSPHEHLLLLSAGTLLGDAPDVDVFFNFLEKKTIKTFGLKGHRDHITHAPIFWFVLGIFVFIISTSNFGKILGLLLWLCPWSHFVCDSVFSTSGIKWLWPFSKKEFTLLKYQALFPKNWRELFLSYSSNPLMYLELLIMFTAIAFFLY